MSDSNNNFSKLNDMSNLLNQQNDENIANSAMLNKEGSRNRIEDLIIDDNTVYEIDQDCYERVKKKRLSQRQGWDRR